MSKVSFYHMGLLQRYLAIMSVKGLVHFLKQWFSKCGPQSSVGPQDTFPESTEAELFS